MFKKRNVKINSSVKRRTDHDETLGDDTLGKSSTTEDNEQAHSLDTPPSKKARKQFSGVKLSGPSLNPSGPTSTTHTLGATSFEAAKPNSDSIESKTEIMPHIPTKPLALKPLAANIRTSTITDFAPDVCKDFLQTGYCGYGDTCKFLHVRDELRQSKPIKKDWELVAKGKGTTTSPSTNPLPKVNGATSNMCLLCKRVHVHPVKTNCGHVYCKECFMRRCEKIKACVTCGKDTGGIMIPVTYK